MWYIVEAKVLRAYKSLGEGVQSTPVGSWKSHSYGDLRTSSSVTAYAKAWRLQRSWHNRGAEGSLIIMRMRIYSAHLHLLILYCTCFESEYNSPVTDHSE